MHFIPTGVRSTYEHVHFLNQEPKQVKETEI